MEVLVAALEDKGKVVIELDKGLVGIGADDEVVLPPINAMPGHTDTRCY